MDIEQIFYTATFEDHKLGIHRGYGVVAKSDGIKDDLLKFLDQYHYPLGNNDQSIFNTNPYKSLVKFKDLLIYTYAKTSVGCDGRDNTYYTNHFVFKESEFPDIDNDTRILDCMYVDRPHTTRWLPTIRDILFHNTDYPNSANMPEYMDNIPYFKEIIDALQKKKKVRLITKLMPDMQYILGSLNIRDRIIPWSNRVPEPKRQPAFRFITGDHHSEAKGFTDFNLWRYV